MPYSTALKHLWLNAAFRNTAGSLPIAQAYVSAHTADPGDTGANEVSGGSPAYIRKAINFGAPAAGAVDSSNQPVLDIPAATTVTHLGLWSAESAGTWLGSADVADEAFTNQGTYTVTDADLDLNA